MTLPVSKYEELLETVRNLKQQTIRVRELASPLLDTIISANTGETSTSTVTTTTTSSSSSIFFPFNYRESQDENKDAPLNYSLYEQNDYYYLNQVRSLSAMDSLLMEQRQQFDAIADEDGTTATHVSRRSSSSSSSCEPRDKYHHHHSHQFHQLDQHQHHTDNMWHSEPSPLNLNLLKRQNQHQHQQLSPHESVSPTDMNSVMSFASSSGAPVPFGMCLTSNEMMSSGGGVGGGGECEEARQRQQQLDVKVEMVYSLLAVLGTSECPDMGETLLALSSSPDSCRAMRQAGCLSILVQLVHAKDDENGKTREKAAQALRNLVQGQTDEKQKKRELKILKLLEDIRTHCNCYFSMDVDSNVSDVQTETEVSKDENQKDKDQHPTQATENIIKLSFDEGYRHTICELGGIFTLARLIEIEHSRHGSLPTSEKCVTLRRYAGMALTNLTFGHGRNKSLLCSFNVFMKCLVTQLSSTTDELRQVTASVLRNLSWRADGASRAALRDAGAVTALMHAAMKSRREATLKSVLSALWNLSAHCSTNKADICAVPGALAFLVDMLGYRPPTGAGTLTIIENAGGILRNVSSHIAIRDDYRAILRDKGCLPLLLQQLKSPSLTVVSNACGTLWNLSAKCEQDQRALWDMGAAPMLRSLNHSKHAMIATGSRAALKNLLSSRPAHNLFNHMDATAREMGLPTLPTLGARKQRALAKDLDQNLSETCDNIEPTSPPQLLSPISSQLSMVTSNTTIMTTATTTTTSTTQQLVESFASLNLTKVDDINIDNIPSSSIRSKLTDYHFDYNRQQDDNDLDLDLHLDLDDDNHEQPINYSEKYMENQIKPNKSIENLKKNTEATTSNTNKNRNNRNYSDYAETDLDQPTNYSLRYAENDSDSDIIQDEELFDTVKTYCTEGTPLNFSTATSMSDLRQIDAIAIEDKHKKDKDKEKKQQIQAPKYRQSKESVMRKIRGECQSSGLMTPEKPVKYCEEGTPRSFSRHSSFSSLNIDDKQNTTVPGTNDDEQVGVEEDKTTTTPPEKVENSVSTVAVAVATSTAAVTTPTIAIAAAAAAATTATTGAEETPLMFSRCSSLCSLSSAEQHSIHDDRSSIISDFSRLTSGIVSPSELPDSPTQTVPPSPRQRRAPVDFTTQSKPQLHQQQPPMNQQQQQHQHQPLKSVFEDNVIKFKQANTPIEFSANTSLSSLTIDDDPPSNINFNILTGIVLGATPTDININMDKTAKSQSTSQMAVTNTNTNATASTAKQTTPLTLTLTINNQNDVDEQEEDDMLAACINIGIQNNRHREKKQSKQPSAKLPIRIQTHSNTSRSNIPTEVDSTRVYCTEDTPAMLSHAGSQSDLSLLSVESSAVNHRKCSENVNVNVLDLSDDSSNLSGDNESNILAECIQSGMPKAKTQQPRVAAIAAIAARDETSTYAVEDSPCQFSLRSSLSDLTIDGIKINNSSSSSKKIQPQPQLQLQIESRAESLSSLSVESFGSTENAEQALLEQCISSGMPPKNKPNTNTSLNSLEIESASSSKNGQAPSVTWTNRVTGENDDINIKNEYVNMTTINTNTNTNTTKNTLIENFTSWPQHEHEHEHETKQENNIINTEIIVKNNLDTVDKCSDLLDGSIEDNCYEHKTNELEVENNRMLDPDAMIESLDRFTAELVSQSSHLQQSYGNGNGNGNDTWNEDTSPNDISFPSISVSAPLVASFNSESDKLSKHEHEQELASFDTTSTMTESTLIAIEAANIVNTVRNEGLEMQESITSLDLEHMKPPSVMDSLVSLTSSLSINEPLPLAPKTNSPLAARKRSLPISNLMMRRALNNVNVNVNKNSNENLHQIHDSISSSSCSNLDYCKPPSVMGDFLDLVDMENSMISVASITSETIGDQEDGGHMYVTAAVEPCDCDSTADLITDNVFQDCLTHQAHDDVTITEYSDANSVTPIQSDFASSSAESTPKKERTICMRMTPKQRRQYAKDRYKTYTVAAEMCIKQVVQTETETETETISSNEKQNRLTPKERRQLDRERFQTRVLDVELIQKQIEQQEQHCKERFQTQAQTILNGTLETAEDDLHVVLAQQANIVLDTLHADELLDCETLSLVSNDDESELNSVSSINYRTYHKSWGLTKNNLPIVIHQQKQQDQQNTIDEQTVNSNKTPKIPKIVKPNDITITNSGSGSGSCNESTFQEDQQEEKEEIVKAVRGRRKPLYSSASSATSIRNKKPTTISSTTTATPIKTTPLKSNIKQPFRTMTSNLVKNVTTTIKATTRNNTKAAIANKPPIAVAKFNVVRSNTTIQQQQQQQQQQKQQIDTKKPELLKNRSSSNGSIPLNSKPLERQGTFTKDNTTTTKKTATNSNSKIPESKIPTQKFRTSAIQNRTVSSTTATTTTAVAASKITNRSPSTDRSSSSDFGFRNRRSPNTQIHQSNSTQSLQNGTNCTNDLAVKRSSNPDITDATPKRKPVASRIASLWKKSHSDVGVSMGAKKTTTTNSTATGAVKMRVKKTTTNSNSADQTKRISRLGSFIKVDEISVT